METIAEWVSVHDAALRLGIARLSVREAIERGRIRAVRTRLGYLIDPESVEDFARTRRPARVKGVKVKIA
jgi:excisionase family DNA binding protein